MIAPDPVSALQIVACYRVSDEEHIESGVVYNHDAAAHQLGLEPAAAAATVIAAAAEPICSCTQRPEVSLHQPRLVLQEVVLLLDLQEQLVQELLVCLAEPQCLASQVLAAA